MPFNFEFPDYSQREACVAACPSKRIGTEVTLTAAELGGKTTEDLEVLLAREGDTVKVLNVLGTKLGGFPRQVTEETKQLIIAALTPRIATLLPRMEDTMEIGPDGEFYAEI